MSRQNGRMDLVGKLAIGSIGFLSKNEASPIDEKSSWVLISPLKDLDSRVVWVRSEREMRQLPSGLGLACRKSGRWASFNTSPVSHGLIPHGAAVRAHDLPSDFQRDLSFLYPSPCYRGKSMAYIKGRFWTEIWLWRALGVSGAHYITPLWAWVSASVRQRQHLLCIKFVSIKQKSDIQDSAGSQY